MTAEVIAAARAEQRTLLSEVEAKQLLAEAGVNVTETRLATSIDEAAAHAAELGYPVALKVVSDSITHKTDVGGVELGVADEAALRDAYLRIHERVTAAAPNADVQGVSVQPMAEAGAEVILGITQDQQFGPVLMFGLGGVFVEVLKDVAFRIVPLEPRDASEMVREIQGFPVLEGFRGTPAANLDAIESMLLKLSEFAEANPEIAELDLNPVFARPDGAVAVDARILLTAES
ncbi:MAG: acetate--CoA ligase family protein [Chloroflexi bacterium]|nr:acetate--CoA ligase family protein [Chloroflexota bacterium]